MRTSQGRCENVAGTLWGRCRDVVRTLQWRCENIVGATCAGGWKQLFHTTHATWTIKDIVAPLALPCGTLFVDHSEKTLGTPWEPLGNPSLRFWLSKQIWMYYIALSLRIFMFFGSCLGALIFAHCCQNYENDASALMWHARQAVANQHVICSHDNL